MYKLATIVDGTNVKKEVIMDLVHADVCGPVEEPDLRHLKVFESKAMYQISKQEEAIFIGYAEFSKGYMIYNPELTEVIVSRDVII